MTNENNIQPERKSDNKGWLDFGPRNLGRDAENPDILVPPVTDMGLCQTCVIAIQMHITVLKKAVGLVK